MQQSSQDEVQRLMALIDGLNKEIINNDAEVDAKGDPDESKLNFRDEKVKQLIQIQRFVYGEFLKQIRLKERRKSLMEELRSEYQSSIEELRETKLQSKNYMQQIQMIEGELQMQDQIIKQKEKEIEGLKNQNDNKSELEDMLKKLSSQNAESSQNEKLKSSLKSFQEMNDKLQAQISELTN